MTTGSYTSVWARVEILAFGLGLSEWNNIFGGGHDRAYPSMWSGAGLVPSTPARPASLAQTGVKSAAVRAAQIARQSDTVVQKPNSEIPNSRQTRIGHTRRYLCR
jgi:hypothetical protein